MGELSEDMEWLEMVAVGNAAVAVAVVVAAGDNWIGQVPAAELEQARIHMAVVIVAVVAVVLLFSISIVLLLTPDPYAEVGYELLQPSGYL